MEARPIRDLSLDRVSLPFGDDGYNLWFGLPPREGDATSCEIQTLCQGSILVGWIAQGMGWDWAALLRNVDRLTAPMEDYLVLEVRNRLLDSPRFRHALHDAVLGAGLDPYKVKVMGAENGDVHIFGHGLPPV